MAQADQNLRFALASLCLRTGDAEGAAALFEIMTRGCDVRECWTGLALASLQTGFLNKAVAAVQRALSTHTTDGALASVAGQVARAASLPGWCGVQADGILLVEPRPDDLEIALDGQPCAVQDGKLPLDWRNARRLTVKAGRTDFLGSPVMLPNLLQVDGFVERTPEGAKGWAWNPAAPEHSPTLTITIRGYTDGLTETRHVTAREMMLEISGSTPLSRPRRFGIAAAMDAEIHVRGSDGRHLLGSPLFPAISLSTPPAPTPPVKAEFTPEPDLPVDVIIPVYRGVRTTRECLAAVIATVPAPHRIIVVDDATPEPDLAAALEELAIAGAVTLVRPAGGAGGFPAAANAGLRMAAGRHAVLLNSDTLVAPGWLETLRAASCSAPDIGTATPLSNEASIFSYPSAAGENPVPDAAGTRWLAALAGRVNAGRLVDVPTAHGFCMFIRRDCLAATGLLDDRSFAQGYGEENDFCERARIAGYRHVAVPSVFVAHVGGVSFGTARADLLRRNLTILRERYPDYLGRVAEFIAADPLAPARRRLDEARWRARATDPGLADATGRSVLLITHGGGGGTARIVGERAAALRKQGLCPVVLRAVDGMCEVGDAERAYPNLAYALPGELAGLARLLRPGRPINAELHNLLGHDHSIMRLFRQLSIPYDIWVHDYAWFCARISFTTGEGKFCGEAPAAACNTCVAAWGRGIDDPVSPAALRARSATDFRAARRVVVPSSDVAARVRRQVPDIVFEITPWEAAPAPSAPTIRVPKAGSPTVGATAGAIRRVAVVGAIGQEKGFDVLLACARDAAARALALEFVVVGYTVDDAALLDTGRAFVTGEFTRAEAAELVRSQGAQLAFLPSIWPETWCYALSDVWEAGLSVAVFDIGTPAQRVRHSGAGWVLPLGLPPSRVNEVLLSL